jgi:transcriptional regulator with XRE-family HTH domain
MFAKNLPVVFSSTELTSEPGRVAEGAIAMPLDALRDARQLTQVQMAQLLKISQGAVSKVERRTDMFVSTLRNYVRAIGGDLEIRAVFPEGDVLIDQFSQARRRDHSAARRREVSKPAAGVLPAAAPDSSPL